MTSKKYIIVSIEDEKIKSLAEVLGNKTCKKIIDFLSETNEASEKDISDKLNIPLNTAEYNLRKLVDAKLVEKSKNFFWSRKGKKIIMYKLSNKSIIISPKSKIFSSIKTIVPVALISGLASVTIRQYFEFKKNLAFSEDAVQRSVDYSGIMSEAVPKTADTLLTINTSGIWLWFLAGALFALLVISIINLKGGKNE
ncbi:MAG: helix-turn-helix domain-containing protein [archaeon]